MAQETQPKRTRNKQKARHMEPIRRLGGKRGWIEPAATPNPTACPITEAEADNIAAAIAQEGWERIAPGYIRASTGQRPQPFALFHRSRSKAEFDQASALACASQHPAGTLSCALNTKCTAYAPAQTGTVKLFSVSGANHPLGPKGKVAPVPPVPPDGAPGDTAKPMSGGTSPDDGPARYRVSPGDGLFAPSSFDGLESLAVLRDCPDALVVAYDSEWVEIVTGDENSRRITSWQMSVIYGGRLHEYVWFPLSQRSLPLDMALSRILNDAGVESSFVPGLKRYGYCPGTDDEGKARVVWTSDRAEADAGAVHPFIKRLGRFSVDLRIDEFPEEERFRPLSKRNWAYYIAQNDWGGIPLIPVALVSHFGVVDLSALEMVAVNGRNLLEHCLEASGTAIMTQYPVEFEIIDRDHDKADRMRFPIRLDIRDTMALSPPGKKGLAALGDLVGVPKVRLPDGAISCMNELRHSDPSLYMRYAANDAVVTLLYAASLSGVNRRMPMTLPASSASAFRASQMRTLDLKNVAEYNSYALGIREVEKGLLRDPSTDGFLLSSSYEAVSFDAHVVQELARLAYMGGLNGSMIIGDITGYTTDFDLCSAYPSAMCMVDDVDWSDPIAQEFRRQDFTLEDFTDGPLTPILAHVQFEFPEEVRFPTILANVDGVPVYVRSSEGIENFLGCDGVCACGPEIYLALKLGARVRAVRGYRLNTRGTYSMRSVMCEFVRDRAVAKASFGKGSLPELLMKVFANSSYGKIAQCVTDKRTWNNYWRFMETMAPSGITNPVSAAMITSIVRAELLAVMTQATDLGYSCYSVTTDGFISDIPTETLGSLDMFGLRDAMAPARRALTGGASSGLWEAKHTQTEFINASTRLNVAFDDGGVLAHGSWVGSQPKDSPEDRRELILAILSREGRVPSISHRIDGLRKTIEHGYVSQKVRTELSFNFDMKRRPVRESFRDQTVAVPGESVTYTMAYFETEAFSTYGEYLLYRDRLHGYERRKKCALRTRADWNELFALIDCKLSGLAASSAPTDQRRFRSVVMAARMGRIDMPALGDGSDLTVAEKIAWLNYVIRKLELDCRDFTEAQWKDARKACRQVGILPRECWNDLAEQMRGVSVAEWRVQTEAVGEMAESRCDLSFTGKSDSASPRTWLFSLDALRRAPEICPDDFIGASGEVLDERLVSVIDSALSASAVLDPADASGECVRMTILEAAAIARPVIESAVHAAILRASDPRCMDFQDVCLVT